MDVRKVARDDKSPDQLVADPASYFSQLRKRAREVAEAEADRRIARERRRISRKPSRSSR